MPAQEIAGEPGAGIDEQGALRPYPTPFRRKRAAGLFGCTCWAIQGKTPSRSTEGLRPLRVANIAAALQC